MSIESTENLIDLALREDIGGRDLLAELFPPHQKGAAQIIAKESAIICGTKFVDAIFHQLDQQVSIDWQVQDGAKVAANQIVCLLTGPLYALLQGERTALNFLQTLSGTATLTSRAVAKLAGTNALLLDTRKTLPGLRLAQKYAVRCGGGHNHRFGLYDKILLKDNHIAAVGSITSAVALAAKKVPGYAIEIEVKNLLELKEALYTDVTIIMLDNFTPNLVVEAVKLKKKTRPLDVKLEASGGISMDNLRDFALTGVDYISLGFITKNVQATDFSMLFDAIKKNVYG